MAKRQKAKKTTKSEGSSSRSSAGEAFFRPFQKLAPKNKSGGKKSEPSAADRVPPKAPAPAASPGPLAADEAQTFAMYMAGVRALQLDNRATRIPKTASQLERTDGAAIPKEDPDAEARARLRSLVIEGMRFEMIDDGDRIEGRRIDVDHRELRRLRRAIYAIDGKLDLHGLGADEARQAVEAFVKKRALDGDKVVVIVHGKGHHSPRQQAVLRGEIGAWLSQGRSARYIRAFTTAPEDEGGTGAVLVLLAR